jgi:hypothetical protein
MTTEFDRLKDQKTKIIEQNLGATSQEIKIAKAWLIDMFAEPTQTRCDDEPEVRTIINVLDRALKDLT